VSIGPLVAEILVPGPPVPWMRARSDASGRRFTAKKDKGHRNVVALIAATKPKAPKDAPLHVHARFVMPRAKTKASTAFCTRGDVDNLAKGVLDALQGITYDDDRLVVSLFAEKLEGDDPRTEIRVSLVT
jgi:Holliday junction resolvase RusA-like endonuclease